MHDSLPLAPRRITLLARALPRFLGFCAVAALLGGAAGRWVGQPYAFVTGLALAFTGAAAVSAWRVRPESLGRWWLAVVLFWLLSLGAVWLPRHPLP